MRYLLLTAFTICIFLINISSRAQITRIWLTHSSAYPSAIVVNWQSKKAGSSEVFFRAGNGKEKQVIKKEKTDLHHVSIPLTQKDIQYHYYVKSGSEVSEKYTFKGYPSLAKDLKVAVVGNWGYSDSVNLSRLIADDPHLLITLGDNIPNLHELCKEGVKDCIEPYLKLIDSQPGLFRTTPFMPILGNHDKEIRPRGNKYPPLAVYDTTATAYRKFFELPGEEWKWKFSIPDFNAVFVALDLNHITDYNTTWQTCHAFHPNSDQFKWYKSVMEKNPGGHIITLQNEQNMRMRSQEDGEWQKVFQKGTMVISGYGYFSERAEVDGFPYFTTSLKGSDQYADKFSKVIRSIAAYMLLTFNNNNPLKVETKSLDGKINEVYFSSGK